VIDGVATPVASLADVLLLTRDAGGPRDGGNVVPLRRAGERAAPVAEVEASLVALPEVSTPALVACRSVRVE